VDARSQELAARFEAARGARPEAFAHAGGRVNLIGEHTDYHEGLVFPAAIDLRTWAVGRSRSDGRVRVESVELGRVAEAASQSLAPGRGAGWDSYLLGPVWAAREAGIPCEGVDILLSGDVPFGGGLSSSASLEVTIVGLVCALASQKRAGLDVARIARRAENEYAHVPCGLMDQAASACGEAGSALVLDCRSLELTRVPIPDVWALVVADCGVKHALGTSEYNKRQAECAEARQALGVRALRDATMPMLLGQQATISDVAFRRTRHVITENDRVGQLVQALRDCDAGAASRLLDASHQSLRDDYEVSCAELDALVAAALGVPGVIGSRLTGAGFGGNTVSLVDARCAEACATGIAARYFEATGVRSRARVVRASAGLVAGRVGAS
jgi:galactokinase